MENDKAREVAEKDSSRPTTPTTPSGKVPVSALLASPIEMPLVADPIVIRPTLGDSPINWDADTTVSYESPQTPTLLSPEDANKENTPNSGPPTVQWSRDLEHRFNRFATRSPMYSPVPIQYGNYSSPMKYAPVPFILPNSPEAAVLPPSLHLPRRLSSLDELKEEAGINNSTTIEDLLGKHTPIFDSVADAIMEELQTRPELISGINTSPASRRIIVEDINSDGDDMMDLDEDSDDEADGAPPKSAPKSSSFPNLAASPRNLRITVVTPKTNAVKKRTPLSPLTSASNKKGYKASIKKFTIAGKKNTAAAPPRPNFNVFVDPELRPVPQRSEYPDLNQIMATKRGSEQAGSDVDPFALYCVLFKHQGKSLNDIARIIYGSLFANSNKENNPDSFYHTAAQVNQFVKNLPSIFPHLSYYGNAQLFTLARLCAFPEVLVTLANEPLKLKFQQFGGRAVHTDTPRPAKKGDFLRRI